MLLSVLCRRHIVKRRVWSDRLIAERKRTQKALDSPEPKM